MDSSTSTGYATPTGEQVGAVAELPDCGRSLVEVFSVRAVGGGEARPPPRGTVSISDGRRGQIIYSQSEEQSTPTQSSSSSSHAQDRLLLTGPYRAVSADGCFAIKLDLHDPSQDLAPSSSHKGAKIGLISWDIYDSSEEYDKPISRTVDTRYGPVEVIYAVLSSAVEASVEVKLARREEGDDGGEDDESPAACVVRGRIVARSQAFEIGTVLFEGEFGLGSRAGSSPGAATAIPLARSVLAVPLAWPLTVEADLRAVGGGDGEIARGSLEFHPEVDGEQVKRLVDRNGAIEMKITWSGE